MINNSSWSALLSDLTQIIFFFTTNYPIREKNQVINYNWTNIIKIERTFCKLSIRN